MTDEGIQRVHSTSESVKAVAESASVLVLVRIFQLLGIPIILAFLYWLSGSVYNLTIQQATMNGQITANREALNQQLISNRGMYDQRFGWLEREIGRLDNKMDKIEGKP
jgi:hypothetical protein